MVSQEVQVDARARELLHQLIGLTGDRLKAINKDVFAAPHPDLRSRTEWALRLAASCDLQVDWNGTLFLEAFFTRFYEDVQGILEYLEGFLASDELDLAGKLRVFATSIPALIGLAVWAESQSLSNSVFDQEMPRVVGRLLFSLVKARKSATGEAEKLSGKLNPRIAAYLSNNLALYFHTSADDSVEAKRLGRERARRVLQSLINMMDRYNAPDEYPTGIAGEITSQFRHKALNALEYRAGIRFMAQYL